MSNVIEKHARLEGSTARGISSTGVHRDAGRNVTGSNPCSTPVDECDTTSSEVC